MRVRVSGVRIRARVRVWVRVGVRVRVRVRVRLGSRPFAARSRWGRPRQA